MAISSLINKHLNQARSLKYQIKYTLRDWQRIITEQKRLAEIVNKKEIRVIGLRRSGNHAIINWMVKQQSGYVSHLNNLIPQCNPYRVLYCHYPKERLKEESWGHFRKKDCLIYSYEDYSLKNITDHKFEKNHNLYIGKSEVRYDLIILRDPFNLLASRIKSDMLDVKEENLQIIDLWIEYAKEFLQKSNYLHHNKICVNYNRWVSDVNYRQEIATHLNLDFTDTGFNEVRGYGGGSSFDGQDFHGKASDMNVNNRWQHIMDHPLYHQFISNSELMDYFEQIFGCFEGMRLPK